MLLIFLLTLIAHHKAVKGMREVKPNLKYGIVLSISPAIPRSQSKADLEAAEIHDLLQYKTFAESMINGSIPQKIINEMSKHDLWPNDVIEEGHKELIKESLVDFLGVNYYCPGRVKSLDYIPDFTKTITPNTHFFSGYNTPFKRMNPYRGWEIRPKTIYEILTEVKTNYKNIPCFISENGMGVEGEDKWRNNDGVIEDDYRIDFFKEHLYWVHKAIEEGANCFGFHIW